MSSDITEIFLANMDIELKQRGWSVTRLAEITGIPKSYFSNIKARRRNAGIHLISQVADALEIPAFKLLIPPVNGKDK